MNRDQIIAKWNGLSPRERDAWVAEVVFGWEWHELEEERAYLLPPPIDERLGWTAMYENGIPHYLPRYSEDISAAWAVLATFEEYEIGRSEGVTVVYAGIPGWYVRRETSDSVPEAISLAAVLAKLTEPV